VSDPPLFGVVGGLDAAGFVPDDEQALRATAIAAAQTTAMDRKNLCLKLDWCLTRRSRDECSYWTWCIFHYGRPAPPEMPGMRRSAASVL
jgi:hypothetical protein